MRERSDVVLGLIVAGALVWVLALVLWGVIGGRVSPGGGDLLKWVLG